MFKPSSTFLGNNQMAQAISAALVVPPKTKRIFDYIKDYPGRNATAITLALKLAPNSTSSVISQLEQRKMVRSENILIKVASGAKRLVKHYTVCIKEYELLPLPKEIVKPASQSVATCKVVPEEVAVPDKPLATLTVAPQMEDEAAMIRLVDSLTVRQARILHRLLKDMFRD
jgi:hypothetical protein